MTVLTFGRVAFLISGVVALASCAASPSGLPQPSADEIQNVLPHHKTFHYTGREQRFTVPAGVTSITVVALGAAGDGGSGSYSRHHYEYFGRGGRVYAVIPVKSGQTLYVYVGGRGAGSYSGGNGFNGGGEGGEYPRCGTYCYGYGGGGASDVRAGGDSLGDRIVVAGGGGGAGTVRHDTNGGAGGGKVGGDGGEYYPGRDGSGGTGGTQREGGQGGAGGSDSYYGSGGSGSDGKLGIGGNGGQGGVPVSSDGYQVGGAGGGAGGGYYGGGGGGGGAPGDYGASGGYAGAGGGGGSSYVERAATKFKFWRGWIAATGNGLVVFNWK